MPKTAIVIPMAKGLGQGTDEKAKGPDVPLKLENCQFDKLGRLSKRNGFQPLATSVNPAPVYEVDSARALFSTGDELCLVSKRRLFAYDEGTSEWLDRGPAPPAVGRSEIIFRDEQWYRASDSCSHNGYTMYLAQRVYEDSAGLSSSMSHEMVASVHSNSRTTIVPPPLVGFDLTTVHEEQPHAPRVAFAEDAGLGVNSLYGFYLKGLDVTGASLEVIEWDASGDANEPTAWGTLLPAGTVWADTSGQAWANIRTYDAVGDDSGGITVAYVDNTLSLRVTRYDAALSQQATVELTSESVNGAASRVAISVDAAANRIYVMAVIDAGITDYEVWVWSIRWSSLTLLWGPTVVTAIVDRGEKYTNLGITKGSILDVPYLALVWTWLDPRTPASTPLYYDVAIERALVVEATGSATTVVRRCTVASRVKPWFVDQLPYVGAQTACTAGMWTGGGDQELPSLLGADYQTTLAKFTNLLDSHVTFELPDQRYGTGSPGYQLTGVYSVGSSGPVEGSLFDIGNCQTSHSPSADVWRWSESHSAPRGLDVIEAEQDYTAPPIAATVFPGSAVIGGSYVCWYDGDRTCELGHVHPPMPYEVRDGHAPIGHMVSQDWHAWQAHWVAFDANGTLHRSLPTFRFTRQNDPNGTVLTTSAGISFRTCGATNRLEKVWCGVAVYREQYPSDIGSSGNPFRVNALYDATLNVDALTTAIFYDSGTDESDPHTESSNPRFEMLYTIGGEIEAVCPEGARIPAVINGRLWLGDFYLRHRVQYSKPFAPGTATEHAIAPEFNEGFGYVLPGTSQVTGLAPLDQDAVFFTERGIFLNAGEGPDDTGAANDFSGPKALSSDGGCIDPRSVVVTPAGIMYQGDAGIHLLDRGRQVLFIGDAVEDETAAYPVVTSAVLVADKQQVRFTCTNTAGDDGIVLVFDYGHNLWCKWTPPLVATAATVHQGEYYVAEADGQVWQLDESTYDDNGQSIREVVEIGWVQAGQHGGWQRVQNVVAMARRVGPAVVTLEVETDFHDEATAQSHTWSDADLQTFPRAPDVPMLLKLRDQKSHALKVRLIEESTTQGIELSGFRFDVIQKRGALKAASAQRA